MRPVDYRSMDDEQLMDMLYVAEDRLPRVAAEEIAGRDSFLLFLSQAVMEKHSWLAELPSWWAVVHATYLLGHRGGEEVVMPLLTALRWADAYDCDWVTEVLPSICGQVGPAMIPGLTAVARDPAAGWSARDLALKGLGAISLSHPDSGQHVFTIIGQRFMDEGEDRTVRQLAGNILLDFRRADYRLALSKFAREDWAARDLDAWYPGSFDPEEVEWCFRQNETEVWHYQEDWMRFYEPSEIQRRQKRWQREKLGMGRSSRERQPPAGGGRVLPLWGEPGDPDTSGSPPNRDPERPSSK